MIRRLVFFLLALGWFALFQPWGSFADPDAFYHAHLTTLIAATGPLHAFPWLDLTTLGASFADQHFLFHVALIPFIRLFGEMAGAQLAAVTFAALCGLAMLFALEKLRVAHPVFWASCLLVASPMVVRLSLGKASPIAIACFILGITAAALRKPRITFLASAIFALSHGGWLLLLLCIGAFTVGDIVCAHFVEGLTWKSSFLSSPWALFANATLGAAVGLVVHPNFRTLLPFLWVQVVKIGVATPFDRVPLGGEWLPTPPLELLGSLGPLLLLTPIVAIALAKTRHVQNRALLRHAIGFGVVVALLVALTFKSRRFIEYLLPTLTLWLAILWTIADRDTFFAWLQQTWKGLLPEWPRVRRHMLGSIIVFFTITTVASQSLSAYRQLHESARSFTEAWDVMDTVASIADPGDRLFASSWDLFPELFAADDHFRFVTGLDPTFLLDQDPALSDAYFAITQSPSTNTVPMIQDLFQSDFVVLDLPRAAALDKTLSESGSATSIYANNKFHAYLLDASYPLP